MKFRMSPDETEYWTFQSWPDKKVFLTAEIFAYANTGERSW